MIQKRTDIAILSAHPRRFTWLGRTVLASPDPLQTRARVLATDLGWFVATAHRRPELIETFDAFLLFDSIGPDNLSRRDVALFHGLDTVTILCPVPEDLPGLEALFPGQATILSTPPALVYFPLMLPDFTPVLPSWHPEPPDHFLMAGRVRRDFRLIGDIQHALPAPLDVVTDMKKVDLRTGSNLRVYDCMDFSTLCKMASASKALLIPVEHGRRAGLATLALGLALGMPVVASSAPGVEAIADRIAPDQGLVPVRPGDGGQILSVLKRLLIDETWAHNLAHNASRLSMLIEREAEQKAQQALNSVGLSTSPGQSCSTTTAPTRHRRNKPQGPERTRG